MHLDSLRNGERTEAGQVGVNSLVVDQHDQARDRETLRSRGCVDRLDRAAYFVANLDPVRNAGNAVVGASAQLDDHAIVELRSGAAAIVGDTRSGRLEVCAAEDHAALGHDAARGDRRRRWRDGAGAVGAATARAHDQRKRTCAEERRETVLHRCACGGSSRISSKAKMPTPARTRPAPRTAGFASRSWRASHASSDSMSSCECRSASWRNSCIASNGRLSYMTLRWKRGVWLSCRL